MSAGRTTRARRNARLRFLLPLILLAGCGGGSKSPLQQAVGPTSPAAPPVAVPPAPTALLSATPRTVQTGQGGALAWQTTHATAVTIDAIGAVQPSGSQQIIPANSTTYHLTAK